MAVPDQPRVHPDEALLSRDGVGYRCRFEGAYPVTEPRGLAVVLEACRRMRDSKSSRRAMSGLKRAPQVELRLSLPNGLDVRSCPDGAFNPLMAQTRLLHSPLDSVAFVASDPADRRYVGFVVRSLELGLECLLFKLDVDQSVELVATANQVFELAGRRVNESLQRQLEVYRSRLTQMAKLIPTQTLQQFLESHGISDILEIPQRSPKRAVSVFRMESTDSSV